MTSNYTFAAGILALGISSCALPKGPKSTFDSNLYPGYAAARTYADSLESLLAIDANSPEAKSRLSHALTGYQIMHSIEMNIDQEINFLERAVELDSTNALAHYHLAEVYGFKGAEEYYNTKRYYPENIANAEKLWEDYLTRALNTISKILARDEDNTESLRHLYETLFHLGVFYQKKGDPDKALKAYYDAIYSVDHILKVLATQDSKDINSYSGLPVWQEELSTRTVKADAYLYIGMYDDAIRLCELVLDQYDHKLVADMLIISYLKSGRADEAQRQFDRLLERGIFTGQAEFEEMKKTHFKP